MNLQHALNQPKSFELRKEANTRLHGRKLLLARATWIVLVVLTLGIFVLGLPVYFTQLQRACIGIDACALNGAINATGMRALHHLGFSPASYATYTILLYVFVSLVWMIVGLLIFLRRSDDWLMLFVSFFLVTFNPGTPNGPALALAIAYPAWNFPVKVVGITVLLSLGLFLYLFPDGRFVPRWTRWLLVAAIVWVGLSNFFPDTPLNSDNWPPLFGSMVWVIFVGSLVLVQVYRYRRVSNPAQRLQTKWVVYGGSIAIVGSIVLYLLYHLIFPTLSQPGSISKLVSNTGYPLILLALPLSIGIAILQAHLWDIDVLINRTLVYGILTGILAVVYFVSVFALQSLIRGLTNQTSGVAVVGSTLAIVALFEPLRHRIQNFIDHRFYRSKYNAVRTIAAFSESLRGEMELSQLSEQLVTIVAETMQPEHVSLWLRKPEADVHQEARSGLPLATHRRESGD